MCGCPSKILSGVSKGAGNKVFNLKSSPSCQTVSKALATSKNTPAQYFFVSKAVEILSVTQCSWWVVEWFARKPNWKLSKFLFLLVITKRRFSNIFSRILPRTGRRLMSR